MEDEKRLLDESLSRFYNAYNATAKLPHDYGCGFELYPSEIHMIEAIVLHPESNTTELAAIEGLTKGTVSKMTNSLINKGLLRKYQYKDNKKEIYYSLTELGRKAYEGHIIFHENRNHDIYEEYLSYTDEQKKFILEFLDKFTAYYENYTREA